MHLTLTITSAQSQSLGSDSCREFGTTGGSIGRVAGNDWVLPDPERFVSSQHAVIKFQEGNFYLTDTSTNGTFVNSADAPVGNGASIKLNEGDVLHIGDYDMQVTITDAHQSSPTGPTADPFAATGSKPVFESAVDPGPSLDPLAAIDAADSAPMLDNTGPAGADPFGVPAGSLEQESTGPLSGAYVPPPAQPEPGLDGRSIPEDWDKTSFTASGTPEPYIGPPANLSQPGVVPGTGSNTIPEDWDKTAFPSSARQSPYVGSGQDLSQPGSVPHPVQPMGAVMGNAPMNNPDQTGAQQMPTPAGIPESGDTVRRPALQPQSMSTNQGAGGSVDLVHVLLNAGMDEATARQAASAEMAGVMGRLLRIFVSGMMEILQARTEIKSLFRMSMTRMQPVENNPLKFCPDVNDAFFRLFVESGNSFLPADQAFEEGFEDIKAHQLAMMAGLRAAYDSMIENLDPERLQNKFDRELRRTPMFKSLNKTKYWDMYGDIFEEMNRDSDENFRRLFGDAFAKAYEDQMQRLQSMRRR